jgi:hypothetical protein
MVALMAEDICDRTVECTKFPWDPHTTDKNYFKITRIKENVNTRYLSDEDCIIKNPKFYCRKGDIVRFYGGYFDKTPEGWHDWFLQKKDRKKFRVRDHLIPQYAMNQFAIVAGVAITYVKQPGATYYFDAFITMLISGRNMGKMQAFPKYRMPFERKVLFGSKIPDRLKDKIPTYVVDLYNQDYNITDSARRSLLTELYFKIRYEREMYDKKTI